MHDFGRYSVRDSLNLFGATRIHPGNNFENCLRIFWSICHSMWTVSTQTQYYRRGTDFVGSTFIVVTLFVVVTEERIITDYKQSKTARGRLIQLAEPFILFIRRYWHESRINAGVWSRYPGYSQALPSSVTLPRFESSLLQRR